MCPNSDSLSKMKSQWKNKNWQNFWSRRDFDLQVFLKKVILFKDNLVEKTKLRAFSGVQYRLNNYTKAVNISFKMMSNFTKNYLYFDYTFQKVIHRVKIKLIRTCN